MKLPPFSPTILLVDDHSDLRDAVAVLLEREGFQVADANNGVEALNYLRSGSPVSAVILDLDMPVMDGWTFLAEWRNDTAGRALPILILTGVAADERMTELEDVFVMTKPFDFDRLLTTLRRMMIRAV